MSQLSRLVLVLVPLLSWTAAAEPNPERTRKERRVTLSAAPVEIRVAPGTVTTLVFDASLDRQSVELDRTRFALVDVGDRTLILEPLAELKGEVALRVRFADASQPESKFNLITHPAEVDSQVRLFRDARSPEAMQAQVAELEARCAACEAALAALRERNETTGVAGMALAKQFETRGVRVDWLKTWSSSGAGGLRAKSVRRYLAESWVVLAVTVQNTSGQPWRTDGAWLVSESTGTREEARTVAMASETLLPGGMGLVVVEFSSPRGLPGEVFRLVVQGADGNRPLSVEGVAIRDGAQEKSP
ncbi:DUF2381 family protein [Pyxidicoccus caerfyrddinensis]|uniref:DUF2381 family protein n=1 Tax=Pyxidicoccus caerfyrddinensis TaxID=2709663 RepID=UPI0013DA0F0E|nr:DUF2381 family protein [Pyxidicoccus caerfyrddinensis]